MTHISQIANIACLNNAREKKIENSMLDPDCANLVDALFIKFALLCREYDGMYADPKRENAEKLQWVRAFTKHNLKTQSLIQNGIDKTEKHKYGRPPQLGQFLEWCERTPESCGLPNVLVAFSIACQISSPYDKYIHPHVPTDTVIKHIINQIGSNQFRVLAEVDARKLFGHYYTVACRQYIDGIIEDIARALPEKVNEHPMDWEKSNDARLTTMESLRKMGMPIKQRIERSNEKAT